jgi:hypothetical protein
VAYDGIMTTDMPSSDAMIRRAKETLVLEKDDFLPKVDEDLADRDISMGTVGSSVGDGMPSGMPRESTPIASSGRAQPIERVAQPVRSSRVTASTVDHLAVAPRKPRTLSVPVPPAPYASGSLTGSGLWMRVVGNLVLGVVAVIWVLLLIGLIDSPDDLGEIIGGGAVMTLVPLLFGLILRRAGKRRGIAV